MVSTMAKDRVIAAFRMASRWSSYSFRYINLPANDIHAITVDGSTAKRKRTVMVYSETIPKAIWNIDIVAITMSDTRESSSAALRSSEVLL